MAPTDDPELSSDPTESPYYFFPPLVVQRRSCCVGILKREGIRSVLELGCGEGALLGLLSHAATHLDEFPPRKGSAAPSAQLLPTEAPGDSATQARAERLRLIEEEIVAQVPQPTAHQRDLHLELLIGLDLEKTRLKYARKLISLAHHPSPCFRPVSRWEALTVELWQGDLTVPNERFCGLECVVMSEVIEHLFPDQLTRAVPLLFASYQPEWIIITTPNYEFNEHIDQYSSASARAQHRFLDPTGRTERFFRDSDHKFEWTRAEFKEWCDSVCSEYDYDYQITGCGSYTNYFGQFASADSSPSARPKCQLPSPDSPGSFCATQVVVFHRRSTSHSFAQLTKGPIDRQATQHELVATEAYVAHPLTNRPAGRSMILEDVKNYLLKTCQRKVELRELWLCRPGLDILCGGIIMNLLEAFSEEDGWEMAVDKSQQGMDAVWITWLNYAPEEQEAERNSFTADDDGESSSIGSSSSPEVRGSEPEMESWPEVYPTDQATADEWGPSTTVDQQATTNHDWW